MACLLSRSFRPPSYQLARVCPACPVLLLVHLSPACLFVLDRSAPSWPSVLHRSAPSCPSVLVPLRLGSFCLAVSGTFTLRLCPDPGPSLPDRLPLTVSLDPLHRPAHVLSSADLRAAPLAAAFSFVCFVLAAHCTRQARAQDCKLIEPMFS